MIEAQHCLNKARFFSKEAASLETQDRIRFIYCFETAIVWARSITLLLQRQYCDVPGFADWYEGQRQMLEADPLARFLLEERNYVLKQRGVRVRKVVSVTAHVSGGSRVTASVKVMRGSWRSRIRYLRQDSLAGIEHRIGKIRKRLRRARPVKPKREPTVAVTVDRMSFSEQPWNNEPALVLLERHLDVLQAIVDEAVRRFGEGR